MLVGKKKRGELAVRLLPRVRGDELTRLDAAHGDVAVSVEVLPCVGSVSVVDVAGRRRVQPSLSPVRVDEEVFVLGQRQVLLAGQPSQLVRDGNVAFLEGAAGTEPAPAEAALADVDV